jgi:hypothetical protein
MDLAAQEGRQVTEMLSVQPEASFSPIFEDINIYTLDAKLRGITNPSLLPTPRYSYENRGDARYRVHLNGFPVISGLVEERNARGTISIPSQLLIKRRDTYDTILNGGINPVLHWGNNTIAFTPGVQFTIRKDTISPVDMNQNLFRAYLYMYTSPFANWVTVSGSLMREAGPFTEQNLHSRDAAGALNFIVGRPWGKTALITGYSARDVLFRPAIREYYTTSTYAGVQRKVGQNFKVAVFAEYLRSWRVQDNTYAIAQAMRPGFRIDYMVNARWSVQCSGAWWRGDGYHAYDNVNNEIVVSYVRPLQRPVNDGMGEVPVTYPLRFSFGLQQQAFYHFSGNHSSAFLPIVRLSFF